MEKDDLLWAFRKFVCPGRHWASAQIKLLLIVLMLEFGIGYENGLRERPQNVVVGAKCVPSMTQKVILRKRPRDSGQVRNSWWLFKGLVANEE